MAAYTQQNALDYVQKFVKGIPVTDIDSQALDMINSIIWSAYPWRWSLKSMTAIPLVDAQQDYTFAPTDYFRMARARITRTDTTPDQFNDILIMRWLAPDLTKRGFADISSVCYEGALSKLRITTAASVPSGITLQIDGEYQFVPTKITDATLAAGTFPFPDMYFNVLIAGLMWLAFKFADDARAGVAQSNGKGQVIYTGQMGEFYDALVSMREAEEWGAGDTIFPSDPLGASSFANPNIFGP